MCIWDLFFLWDCWIWTGTLSLVFAAPGLRVPVWSCVCVDDECLHSGDGLQHYLSDHRSVRSVSVISLVTVLVWLLQYCSLTSVNRKHFSILGSHGWKTTIVVQTLKQWSYECEMVKNGCCHGLMAKDKTLMRYKFRMTMSQLPPLQLQNHH